MTARRGTQLIGRLARLPLRRAGILAALAAAACLWAGGLLQPLGQRIVDARFQVLARPATGRIAVATIDTASLARIGVWPWPREIHARLLDALVALGADEVAFDVDFSSRSTPGQDERLASALEKADGKVLLAAMAGKREGAAHTDPVLPDPRFADHAWLGLVDVYPDRDGVLRRFPTGAEAGGQALPSMPVLLADRSDPPAGRMVIDFAIDAAGIDRIPVADILDGRVAPERVRGRRIIVGATAPELRDLFLVPTSLAMPGPVVQAVAAETLLQHRELVGVSPVVPAACMVALAILALLPGRRMGWWSGIAVMLAAACGIEAAAIALQARSALVLDTVPCHAFLALFGCAAVAGEIRTRGRLWLEARSQSRSLQALLNRVVEDNFEGIAVVDGDGLVRAASAAIPALLLRGEAAIVGRPVEDALPGPLARLARDMLAAPGEKPITRTGEMVLHLAAPGDAHTFEYVATSSLLGDGDAGGDSLGPVVCLTFRDVTEQRRAARQIAYLAHYDSLTGLPNRHRFRGVLDTFAARPGPHGVHAVLVMTVSGFRWINEMLGQSVGDAILKGFAQTLSRLVADLGSPARLGGVEFAAIVTCADAEALRALGLRLERDLSVPAEHAGFHGSLAVRIGAAILAPGDLPEDLMRRAGAALDQARAAGSGFALYDERLESAAAERRVLEQELRAALAGEEFVVFYQPQVALVTGALVGVEALVRWRHPEKGLVGPNVFIPVLEEMGLIHALGEFVLRSACRHAAAWESPIKVAVNVSSPQFARGRFEEVVAATLADTGLPPARLELELTESLLLSPDGAVAQTLAHLQRLGVGLALDDFGTGYSSLGYLGKLPLGKLKIDRSFVRDLPGDAVSATIVSAIVSLARGLGITVIAEGIETPEQHEALLGLGCDQGQGYLYGKPEPEEATRARAARPRRDRPAA